MAGLEAWVTGLRREQWASRENIAKIEVDAANGGITNGTLAFGTNVAPNQTLPRGAIVDLAPTVLYYLGVPIGRDMDGFARADLFLRSYTVEHPVTYTATYER